MFVSVPASPALAGGDREELRDDLRDVLAVCAEEGVRSDDCRDAAEEFVDEHRELLEKLADKYGDD